MSENGFHAILQQRFCCGGRMKRFVEETDREQGTLFPECMEDCGPFCTRTALQCWNGARHPIFAIGGLWKSK